MKIIAVGMNYRRHLPELNSPEPSEPVIFIKPSSSLANAPASTVSANMPFFLPDFSDEIEYETEIVVKICRLGKGISEKFAHRYYDEVTVGLDITARDLQRELRSKGLPWEISKGFDRSAVVGGFVDLENAGNIQNIDFSLKINGITVQSGNTSEMIFSVDRIIEYASRFFTLKTGDLIFTGTPAGVGRLKMGDHLEGFISDKKMLDLRIR